LPGIFEIILNSLSEQNQTGCDNFLRKRYSAVFLKNPATRQVNKNQLFFTKGETKK
jgi:hypothetical protein